jgi:hypothetical protein
LSATAAGQAQLTNQQTRAVRVVAGGYYEPLIAPTNQITIFTLNTATQAMAQEFARDNIRVNAVCPVMSATGLLTEFMGGPDTPETRAAFADAICGPDFQEGHAAFMGKRKPVFPSYSSSAARAFCKERRVLFALGHHASNGLDDLIACQRVIHGFGQLMTQKGNAPRRFRIIAGRRAGRRGFDSGRRWLRRLAPPFVFFRHAYSSLGNSGSAIGSR